MVLGLPHVLGESHTVLVEKMGIFTYVTAYCGIDISTDSWYYVDSGNATGKIQGPFNAQMMDVHWRNNTIPEKTGSVFSTAIALRNPKAAGFNKNVVDAEEFVPVTELLSADAYKKVVRREVLDKEIAAAEAEARKVLETMKKTPAPHTGDEDFDVAPQLRGKAAAAARVKGKKQTPKSPKKDAEEEEKEKAEAEKKEEVKAPAEAKVSGKKKGKKGKAMPADPSILGTYTDEPKKELKEPETWAVPAKGKPTDIAELTNEAKRAKKADH